MKRLLTGMVALAALAVGASPALADRQTERQAQALLNKAGRQASHEKVCKIQDRPPSVTHDPPSQELLNTLGIMRRPTAPGDALPTQGLTFFHFAQDLYVDYVRVAHAADGTSYFVFAARNVGLPVQTDACLHQIHVRLLGLVKGKPKRVRHRALRLFDQRVRLDHKYAKRAPREGVFLFDRRADGSIGGGGGGTGATVIQQRGMFGSSGAPGAMSHVSGLIPDGVATVTSSFPQTVSRGAGNPPKVYPAPIERTDPVQDNVISFSVQRDPEDAFASKMVWRAADGSVVRVVGAAG
jgi:hypothetical protein